MRVEYFGLPKAIQTFITEHHGTSAVEYFYREALARSDDDSNVRRDAFRYSGPRPRTRETAIVMLADSVEAATRSLADPAPGRIQAQIHNVIMSKLTDGQLDKCPLTLRDLRLIEDSFFQVAAGIFHKRPVLPKASKTAEGQKTTVGGPSDAAAQEEGARNSSGKGGAGNSKNHGSDMRESVSKAGVRETTRSKDLTS